MPAVSISRRDVQPLTVKCRLLVRTRTDDVEALRSAVTAAMKEVAPEMPFQVFPMRTTGRPRRMDLSGLLGGGVVTRPRRPALRVLGDARRRLVPRGPADPRVRRPHGARRQRRGGSSGGCSVETSRTASIGLADRVGGRRGPDTPVPRVRPRFCRSSAPVLSWWARQSWLSRRPWPRSRRCSAPRGSTLRKRFEPNDYAVGEAERPRRDASQPCRSRCGRRSAMRKRRSSNP